MSALSDADRDAVMDLINRSQMKAIEYHEISARWTGPREGDGPHDVNADVSPQHRLDDNEFGIRLVANVTTDFGEVLAAVAATYTYEGEADLRTVLNFGNEVAIMAAFPYLREAVSSASAKVFGEPILLPVLPRGQVGFDVPDDPSLDAAAKD
ncbi:hypothetical protein [Microbacterium dauci]|uniref:Preprotein translocase subunit SecB n=1 Tax=Microbacterium dauci TaxID=3048008 RepID=A0ABT6ZCS3_9MICO|nr:hypothetical protein [Microbacterium sp. LX3-4]MDJ1113806.1 hypothetical protein [Microbacterium sp. LX3-4]